MAYKSKPNHILINVKNPFFQDAAQDLIATLFKQAALEYLTLEEIKKKIEAHDIIAAKWTYMGKSYIAHCKKTKKAVNLKKLQELGLKSIPDEKKAVLDGIQSEAIINLMELSGIEEPDTLINQFIQTMTSGITLAEYKMQRKTA